MRRYMTKFLIKPWKVISRDEHPEGTCLVVRFFKQKTVGGKQVLEGLEIPLIITADEDEDLVVYKKITEEGWDD